MRIEIETESTTDFYPPDLSCSPDPTTDSETMNMNLQDFFNCLEYCFISLVCSYVKIQDLLFRNWWLDLVSNLDLGDFF